MTYCAWSMFTEDTKFGKQYLREPGSTRPLVVCAVCGRHMPEDFMGTIAPCPGPAKEVSSGE